MAAGEKSFDCFVVECRIALSCELLQCCVVFVFRVTPEEEILYQPRVQLKVKRSPMQAWISWPAVSQTKKYACQVC